MRTLTGYVKEQLKNVEFAKEYKALSGEYEIAREIIQARLSANLTQKELAEKIGTKQSNISRIESGSSNPSIATLQNIAIATGKKLQIALR
jgi:DNA-binding XRE family transcriptional regulator